ncbi:MAG: hypothetical protein ACJ72U_16430 [Nitrososphaeraceae archaeon]
MSITLSTLIRRSTTEHLQIMMIIMIITAAAVTQKKNLLCDQKLDIATEGLSLIE